MALNFNNMIITTKDAKRIGIGTSAEIRREQKNLQTQEFIDGRNYELAKLSKMMRGETYRFFDLTTINAICRSKYFKIEYWQTDPYIVLAKFHVKHFDTISDEDYDCIVRAILLLLNSPNIVYNSKKKEFKWLTDEEASEAQHGWSTTQPTDATSYVKPLTWKDKLKVWLFTPSTKNKPESSVDKTDPQ